MNKDDILRKAQTIHEDEYELKVERDGRKLGMTVLEIFFITTFFYFVFIDTSSYALIGSQKVPLDILCIFPLWLCDGVYAWYRFYKLRSKRYLLYSIFISMMLFFILLRFFIETPLAW